MYDLNVVLGDVNCLPDGDVLVQTTKLDEWFYSFKQQLSSPRAASKCLFAGELSWLMRNMDLLRGMEHLRMYGVYYRDVNPANAANRERVLKKANLTSLVMRASTNDCLLIDALMPGWTHVLPVFACVLVADFFIRVAFGHEVSAAWHGKFDRELSDMREIACKLSVTSWAGKRLSNYLDNVINDLRSCKMLSMLSMSRPPTDEARRAAHEEALSFILADPLKRVSTASSEHTTETVSSRMKLVCELLMPLHTLRPTRLIPEHDLAYRSVHKILADVFL